MQRAVWALFLLIPLAAPAQSVITIAPQQCVWRAGDDPAWVAPNLDESAWQANPHWQGLSPAAHIWVRCHADLTSVRAQTHPALQITLYGAYQLFLNGEEIGAAGNMRSGVFSMNAIRQYPVQVSSLSKTTETIALRINYRVWGQSPLTSTQNLNPPQIYFGDLAALNAQRANVILKDASAFLARDTVYLVVGVLALTLLVLFYYDRSRVDLLYLSILCLTIAALSVNQICLAFRMNYPCTLRFVGNSILNTLDISSPVLFFFAVARRRVAFFYWLPIAVTAVRYSFNFITTLLPSEQALSLFRWIFDVFGRTHSDSIAAIAAATAPFVAFWPYTRIAPRRRPLAALCLLLGTTDLAYFIINATKNPQLGFNNVFQPLENDALQLRGVVTACMLIGLLVLLFRDQRQVTEERALLAGEMQAASEIQRMLAPAAIDCAPGLQIDVAFHPMREVGGDFYLCRVLPNGRQRILLGDVSGKGSAAAMTAALLLGGATDHDADSPAALLSHLNRVLLDSRVGGFATCLCADLAPSGELTLANAGHLPPYRKGEELEVAPGLPLGVAADISYAESTLSLDSGETLTLLSDGVIEARNAIGELFGFERARLLSNQSAEQIANAAQAHGQEDDITVLTLTLAPVGVAHA